MPRRKDESMGRRLVRRDTAFEFRLERRKKSRPPSSGFRTEPDFHVREGVQGAAWRLGTRGGRGDPGTARGPSRGTRGTRGVRTGGGPRRRSPRRFRPPGCGTWPGGRAGCWRPHRGRRVPASCGRPPRCGRRRRVGRRPWRASPRVGAAGRTRGLWEQSRDPARCGPCPSGSSLAGTLMRPRRGVRDQSRFAAG